ncbi:MAG: GTPase ObgE [Candidatus Berkelbacteria bacterium]
MFIDESEIYIKAGNGGNGCVSFRHEKYIPNGGPNGGDGGRGGDIIIKVDNSTHGLSLYNRQKRFLAPDGQKGLGCNCSGKNGDDLILKFPAGTQIYEKDNLLLDLTNDQEEFTFLKGGNGGWGNQHFATSIKQAPQWAKEGLKGESKKLRLVLKTIADVGLIGQPNAGKSTILSILTNAHPKIADYPFTTLEPNLGTFVDKDSRIIFADIPGLIEGASAGKGLGIKFLKHIERTKMLFHIIDANSADYLEDYQMIRKELGEFSKELLLKPEVVIINKIDTVDKDTLKERSATLKKKKIKPLFVSAATREGVLELANTVKKELGL